MLPEVVLTRNFWLVVHKDMRKLARVAAFLDWLTAVVQAEQPVLRG